MTDEDIWGWTLEMRVSQLRRLRERLHVYTDAGYRPVPESVEIELLSDPDYIRVGNRMGSYISYTVEPEHHPEMHARGWKWFNSFHDYGPYLAPEDRPEEAAVFFEDELGPIRPPLSEQAVTEREYVEWLRDREEDQRTRGTAVLAAMQMVRNPDSWPIIKAMRTWLDAQLSEPEPALTVRCHSRHRGRPCRKPIARIWSTPHGLYGRAKVAPSKSAKDAVSIMEDWDAALMIYTGDVEHDFGVQCDPQDYVANNPAYGMHFEGIGVPMSCPDHGNCQVNPSVLQAAAEHATRRTLNVDVVRGEVL